jgi:hypothetical protein
MFSSLFFSILRGVPTALGRTGRVSHTCLPFPSSPSYPQCCGSGSDICTVLPSLGTQILPHFSKTKITNLLVNFYDSNRGSDNSIVKRYK